MLKKVVLILLVLGFLGGGILAVWIATIDIPDFNSFEERRIVQSTKIYDRTGKVLLYNIHDDVRRQIISGENISRFIKNATVAIEDDQFYEHNGVKPMAILRSVFVNLGAGALKQGGSTITQQLIKNSVLTKEKKFSRKIKEAVLALRLEKMMGKEEILTLYLNEIPYGGNLYGVEEAAQAFYGKHANEVTLAEAAYIAAIPKAPTFYSPYGQNRTHLDERKNLVLTRMTELGYIKNEEATAAKTETVVFLPPQDRGIKAPHFVIWVRDYLEKKYGADTVRHGGLKVTTTLNWDWQKKAEELVAKIAPGNQEKFNAKNTGLIAIDPKTGELLVMVGSRDYFETANDGNFNITLTHRQPGSSFKPFVYATAFNEGYTPETVVFDLETQFDTNCADGGNCYKPQNYDNVFRGPITLRNALAQSINIPAIKTLYLAGIKDSIKTAKDMGIKSLTDPDRYGLTLVLGGGEVSLLDLTSAYGVFANDGMRAPYASILKVEDAEGKVLEEFTPTTNRVLPENTARLISSVLSDNTARTPLFGENNLLHFAGRDVAAKTGTTNDYRDAWIVGYTPSVALGAWAGNNDNTPMEKKVAGLIIAPLWNALMQEFLKNLPTDDKFPRPAPLSSEIKPVLRGVWQGGEAYAIDKISRKLATEYTPEELREEKVLTNVHSILYWLNKDNPNGPQPSNPRSDPQFELWEQPVRLWAAINGMVDQNKNDIPKDKDDIHKPEFTPEITFTNIDEKDEYDADKPLNVTVEAEGKYKPTQADFFLNNNYLGSSQKEPFSLVFTPQEIPNISARNELKVVVYDDVRNRGEETITLNIDN